VLCDPGSGAIPLQTWMAKSTRSAVSGKPDKPCPELPLFERLPSFRAAAVTWGVWSHAGATGPRATSELVSRLRHRGLCRVPRRRVGRAMTISGNNRMSRTMHIAVPVQISGRKSLTAARRDVDIPAAGRLRRTDWVTPSTVANVNIHKRQKHSCSGATAAADRWTTSLVLSRLDLRSSRPPEGKSPK
jgi:hypothetical protein